MTETDPRSFARDLADDLKELEKELKRTRAEALERVQAECAALHDAAERAEEEMDALAEATEKEIAEVKHALREFKRVLAVWGGHESRDVYEQEKERIIEAIRTAEEALARIESAGETTVVGLHESLSDHWKTVRSRIEIVRLHLALAAGSAENGLDYQRDEARRRVKEAREELAESAEPGEASKVLEKLRHGLVDLGRDIGEEVFNLLDGASWSTRGRKGEGDGDADEKRKK